MGGIAVRPRIQTRRKLLIAATATLLVLSLSFCGWVYKAKNQRDLNRKLLEGVRSGNIDRVRTLLVRGADPNIRDMPDVQLSLWQQIRNALHKDSHPPDAEFTTLLEMALDPPGKTVQDDEDILNREDVKIVRLLLDAGARTEDHSDSHASPLLTAVSYGELPAARMLLDHGADLCARNASGQLAIHDLGNQSGDLGNDTTLHEVEIAALLLDRGIDINATDDEGCTPLITNAAHGDARLLHFMVSRGAHIEARSKAGDSPLLAAIGAGNVEGTQALLECGAEVDIDDSEGNTPLHLAVDKGELEILKMLLARGANVIRPNKRGETALSIAKKEGFKDFIRLMEAAGAKQREIPK